MCPVSLMKTSSGKQSSGSGYGGLQQYCQFTAVASLLLKKAIFIFHHIVNLNCPAPNAALFCFGHCGNGARRLAALVC